MSAVSGAESGAGSAAGAELEADEDPPQVWCVGEKEVQVAGAGADDLFVEHGVDVIRPAFKRRHVQPPQGVALIHKNQPCGPQRLVQHQGKSLYQDPADQ